MGPRPLHRRLIAGAIVSALVLPALAVAFVSLRNQFTHHGALARRPLPGFATVAFRVGGNPARRCALLAATEAARVQGLQGRRDLAGYDAMVFEFGEDVDTGFINHYVPVALSIGWYGADGAVVGHAIMPACPTGLDCPVFRPPARYRTAVETRRGGLEALGLTSQGAVLAVGGACT